MLVSFCVMSTHQVMLLVVSAMTCFFCAVLRLNPNITRASPLVDDLVQASFRNCYAGIIAIVIYVCTMWPCKSTAARTMGAAMLLSHVMP